jgi:transglutaminase-like putative cysteine protease
MSIRIALHHKTHYRFDRLVKATPHTVRLRPAAHTRTPIEAYSLKVLPPKHFINWQQDPFGNYLARVVFPGAIKEMVFEVDVIAEMTVINPFDFFVEEYAKNYPFDFKRNSLPTWKLPNRGPCCVSGWPAWIVLR